MELQHTPRPWSAIGTDVKTPGHNSRIICWTGWPEVPREQARANARLIAAAPDMLAALCSLRDAIIEGDPQTIADTLHRDALPAIAKANGS